MRGEERGSHPPPPGSGGEQSLCLKQKPPVLPPSLSLRGPLTWMLTEFGDD